MKYVCFKHISKELLDAHNLREDERGHSVASVVPGGSDKGPWQVKSEAWGPIGRFLGAGRHLRALGGQDQPSSPLVDRHPGPSSTLHPAPFSGFQPRPLPPAPTPPPLPRSAPTSPFWERSLRFPL